MEKQRIIRKGFSLEEFAKLPFSQMKTYLDLHLDEIGKGTGSSRSAYILSTKKVIKLAKNRRNDKGETGAAQNRAEIMISETSKYPEAFTKIFHYDHKDYYWIEAELVRPLKEGEFKQLTNIGMYEFFSIVEIFINSREFSIIEIIENKINHLQQLIKNGSQYSSRKLDKDEVKEVEQEIKSLINLKDNNHLINIIYEIKAKNLAPGDLMINDHWGKTADGRIVILDYGGTKNVISRYY